MDMPVAKYQVSAPVLKYGLNERHQAVVRFVTFQLFAMIYLQKIAIGPVNSQVGIPLILFLLQMAWVLVWHKISLSPSKLGWYLVFVSCCLFSQILIGQAGSIPSVLQVFAVYVSMTMTTDLPYSGYRLLMGRFIKMMILPSLIVLFQYSWQKVTGLPDFIDMNAMLPKSILQQGFWYNAHYPLWTSHFTRPNGFFFLEPSTVSMYTAAAAILEATYFMRRSMLILLIGATALSTGATGVTLLMIAGPLVLMRKAPPYVIIMAVIVAAVGLLVMASMGMEIPLISRMNELDHATDSGGQRMTVPATELIARMSDPSYFFTGTGPGSTTLALGNPWPIVKIINEYGFLTMISFVIFYISVLRSNTYDLPLKIALSFIFNFTGGYLVDPFMVNFLAILCMCQMPKKASVAAPSYTQEVVSI